MHASAAAAAAVAAAALESLPTFCIPADIGVNFGASTIGPKTSMNVTAECTICLKAGAGTSNNYVRGTRYVAYEAYERFNDTSTMVGMD